MLQVGFVSRFLHCTTSKEVAVLKTTTLTLPTEQVESTVTLLTYIPICAVRSSAGTPSIMAEIHLDFPYHSPVNSFNILSSSLQFSSCNCNLNSY